MPNNELVNLESNSRGVILPVRANAGARRNGIVGVRNGALRVAVTAAPEKGKANRAIIDLLAKSFQLPKSSIELVSGETSPKKRFLLAGTNEALVSQQLVDLIAAETDG
jgi:uncharacterized protein (TIGR00251 family)